MTRTHSTNRILYEPRVLWGMAKMRPDSTGEGLEVTLPRDAFYNGTRWPMILQYLLISPVGYTLQRYATAPAISAVTYKNAMAAALACKVRVTAPGRKSFSRLAVPAGGYRPRAVGLPRPDSDYASSLFGISRWDFDFPGGEGVVMPRLGQMEFNLSGYTFPNVGLAAPTRSDQLVYGHAAFFESSDSFWGGAARWSGALPILPKVPLAGQPTDVYPATPAPVPDDGYGYVGAPPNAPEPNLTFDSRGVWNHKRWMTEEANVGTDFDRFCGMAVLLDQIDLDEYMQDATSPGVVGNPLAPLSQRVAIQARMLAGGSGEDWFYPNNVPLSLAMPSINEAAVVHEFYDPISLDPNAGLTIDLETPPAFLPPLAQEAFSGIYNVGVSVLGYAIIEY